MHGHFDTATLLADGRVLMTGDNTVVDNQDVYTTLAELYDPGTGVFAPTGSLLHALEGATATRLQDGRVLIAGGIVTDALDSPDASSAEIYDPATGKFTATGSLVQQRNDHTATLLGNGEVLIAGGWGVGGGPELATAELYDPKSGTFKPTGPMASTRMRATATLLADGRAMVFGGLGPTYKGMSTVELYDSRTGAFSPAGSVPAWEQGQIVTLLADGDVLTEGGTSGGGAMAYELYDPATGSFRFAGSANIDRSDGMGVLLANGQVLIAGGAYSPHEGDVQPGPHVGTVAFASSGGRERYDLPAPTRASGSGAIAYVPPVTIFATAELYDPTTGKFTRTGSLSHPRDGATVTLLLDGRVLIAGGRTGTGLTTDLTAELYQP
ncbi:MAG TPA: kelch repeat-containing protein [Candidatus Limnocylindrales bacterium]